jgi:hypothetical protein
MDGLTIQGTGASTRGIVAGANGLRLSNTTTSSCTLAGLYVNGVAVIATFFTSNNNGTHGVHVVGSGNLTLTSSTANGNTGSGMLIQGNSVVTSRSSSFMMNASAAGDFGVTVRGTSRWTSTSDTIIQNLRGGVSAGTGSDFVLLAMTNSNISNNGYGGSGGDGVWINGAGTSATLTGCEIIFNHDNGVLIDGSSIANLGDPAMINPGQNQLQSSVLANGAVGVCNHTTNLVSAERNHWSACPPTQGGGVHPCSGGFDIGTDNSGGSFDSFGCLSP